MLSNVPKEIQKDSSEMLTESSTSLEGGGEM